MIQISSSEQTHVDEVMHIELDVSFGPDLFLSYGQAGSQTQAVTCLCLISRLRLRGDASESSPLPGMWNSDGSSWLTLCIMPIVPTWVEISERVLWIRADKLALALVLASAPKTQPKSNPSVEPLIRAERYRESRTHQHLLAAYIINHLF